MESKVSYETQKLEKILLEIGFGNRDINKYMELAKANIETGAQRLHMLDEKRDELLSQIHVWERSIVLMDCLRAELRKRKKRGARPLMQMM